MILVRRCDKSTLDRIEMHIAQLFQPLHLAPDVKSDARNPIHTTQLNVIQQGIDQDQNEA